MRLQARIDTLEPVLERFERMHTMVRAMVRQESRYSGGMGLVRGLSHPLIHRLTLGYVYLAQSRHSGEPWCAEAGMRQVCKDGIVDRE